MSNEKSQELHPSAIIAERQRPKEQSSTGFDDYLHSL